MSFINGVESDNISIMDRGLHYGDGVFETIVFDGKYLLLDYHLQRLVSGCSCLQIPIVNKIQLRNELEDYSKCNNLTKAIVKLIVTRGDGQRGYLPQEKSEPTRIITHSGISDKVFVDRVQGVFIGFSENNISENIFKKGIKSLNRLEQIVLSMEAVTKGFDELLVANAGGDIIEGIKTNLFIIKNDMVYTPQTGRYGIDGVFRRLVCEICVNNSIPIKIATISKKFVLTADEIFLTNSIVGILPVCRIQDIELKCRNITDKISRMVEDKIIKN